MIKKFFIVLTLSLSLMMPVRIQAADYYLPYPGILADHPLYWLKMIRDRVQLILITNKTEKAEKLLNYADKRLGGGWALIEGNKQSLGVTTLTKAEKYLDQALLLGQGTQLQEALKKAVNKHYEVLMIVKEKVPEEFKGNLEVMISRLKTYETSLVKEPEITVQIDFGDDQTVMATVSATTVLEALEKTNQKVVIKDYDWGKLVEGIEGKKNTGQKAWIYYINGQAGSVGADKQEVKVKDLVEWRYEKPLY